MSHGWVKSVVEIMLLLHLITAFPIITNPPAQFFEQLLGIPSSEQNIIPGSFLECFTELMVSGYCPVIPEHWWPSGRRTED